MYCCDRKSRAAFAQSFALWQQATIEITCHDHSLRTLVIMFNRSHVSIGRASTPRSLFYCLFAPHICGVVLHAHPVGGESHIQRNTTGEVATVRSRDGTHKNFVFILRCTCICCAFHCLFPHCNLPLPQIFTFKTYLLCPRLSLCRFPT